MQSRTNKYLFLFLIILVFDFVLWGYILFPKEIQGLELDFLDVGQGDSALIQFPGEVQILIDGGRGGRVLESLSKVMPISDRKIELVLMTHPELDHFGGLIDVINHYEVGMFLGSGKESKASAYQELLQALTRRGVEYISLGEGDAIHFGEYALDILSPDQKSLESKELNDTSIVAMLRKATTSFALYTGDIGFQSLKIENRLLEKHDLSAPILKVPHHGSKYSSSEAFLKAVNPDIAVIEVGKNNYGHPTSQAIERLTNVGAKIYRTDQSGTLKIILDNDLLKIFAERDSFLKK